MVWREEMGGRKGASYVVTDSTAWIMQAGVPTWWTDARAVGDRIEVVAMAIHDLELKRTTGLDGRETRFIQRHDRGACSSPPGYVMNLDRPPPLPPLPPRPPSYSLPSSSPPPHPNTRSSLPVHIVSIQTCPPMYAVCSVPSIYR